jgi:hypothetical protein
MINSIKIAEKIDTLTARRAEVIRQAEAQVNALDGAILALRELLTEADQPEPVAPAEPAPTDVSN